MKKPGFLLLLLCFAAAIAGLIIYLNSVQPKASARAKLVRHAIAVEEGRRG